jgi:hypothetical protein
MLLAVGGGSAAAFTPPTLTGLIGWWDASVTASLSLSGSTVTAIADQSGAGNDLTGVSTPTYNATSFNSRPGIEYTSTEGDGLVKSSLAMGTGNTLTLFAACLMNDPAVGGLGQFARLFSYTKSGGTNDFDNAGSFAVNRDNTNANVQFTRNGVSAATRAMSYASPHRLIVTVKSDGTWDVYVDGVVTSSSQTAANWVSPGYFGLGISQNNSGIFNQFGGKFGEAGLATGWHDATTVASLDTYLKNKWGL